MDTEYIKSQLISLERRLQVFLTRYQTLQEAHRELSEENQLLKQKLAEQKEALQRSYEKFNVAHLAKNLQVNSQKIENSEYSTLIDQYISKIEQCIAHLEK